MNNIILSNNGILHYILLRVCNTKKACFYIQVNNFGGVPIYNTYQICNFDTDTGTEELAHLEIVAAIVHQLTRNLSMEEIEKSGFAPYYVDHTVGVWPQAASGFPFTAAQFQVTGDPVTDLTEDL